MNSKIENEILTLYFEGKINSSNAEDVEKESSAIMAKKGFKGIRIDMGNLDYISSAGLRIIVRMKQQYDDIVLINVPDGVYEILAMVGFPNLIKVERK